MLKDIAGVQVSRSKLESTAQVFEGKRACAIKQRMGYPHRETPILPQMGRVIAATAP